MFDSKRTIKFSRRDGSFGDEIHLGTRCKSFIYVGSVLLRDPRDNVQNTELYTGNFWGFILIRTALEPGLPREAEKKVIFLVAGPIRVGSGQWGVGLNGCAT